MTIYKNKRDGKLYLLYKNSPPGWTGSWLIAEQYFPMSEHGYRTAKIPDSHLNDYVPVATR